MSPPRVPGQRPQRLWRPARPPGASSTVAPSAPAPPSAYGSAGVDYAAYVHYGTGAQASQPYLANAFCDVAPTLGQRLNEELHQDSGSHDPPAFAVATYIDPTAPPLTAGTNLFVDACRDPRPSRRRRRLLQPSAGVFTMGLEPGPQRPGKSSSAAPATTTPPAKTLAQTLRTLLNAITPGTYPASIPGSRPGRRCHALPPGQERLAPSSPRASPPSSSAIAHPTSELHRAKPTGTGTAFRGQSTTHQTSAESRRHRH